MRASYVQILVHVDDSPAAARRLQAARRIAPAQEAAVCALYAVTPAVVGVPMAAEAGPAAIAALRELDDERRQRARAMFEATMEHPGTPATWAQLPGYTVVADFARQALYADLLVLGQHDPGAASQGVPADFVESVLAASGRAAVVLPYVAGKESFGEEIAIAWKPTREAARAVAAAVPMLQRAGSVHVLAWDETETPAGDGTLNLDGYLRQRGIAPTWHHEAGAAPELVGDLLMSRVADLGVDLLVMGCYGHSRAREWVLGGVSRTVLRSMTVPVLMSH